MFRRAEIIGDKATADFCREQLLKKADRWQSDAQDNAGGRTLAYREVYGDAEKRGTTIHLLQSPGLVRWDEFTCLNSLRDVEPQVKFIMSDGGMDGRTDDSDENLPESAIAQSEDEEDAE